MRLVRTQFVVQRHRHRRPLLYHPHHSSLQVMDSGVADQVLLHANREHTAVGAADHVASLGSAERRPLRRVAEQRVLEEALSAGVDRGHRRDDGDRHRVVPNQFVQCRAGGLSTADHGGPGRCGNFPAAGEVPELGDAQYPWVPGQGSIAAARAGDHQRVSGDLLYRAINSRHLDIPAGAIGRDLVRRPEHHLQVDLARHPLQVLRPCAVRRCRSAPIDPFRVGAAIDEIRRPAVGHHPRVDLVVVPASDVGTVRESDVLFRARAQSMPTVGPSTPGLPVGADGMRFHRQNTRRRQAELPHHRRLGRDSKRFRSGPDDQ